MVQILNNAIFMEERSAYEKKHYKAIISIVPSNQHKQRLTNRGELKCIANKLTRNIDFPYTAMVSSLLSTFQLVFYIKSKGTPNETKHPTLNKPSL